MGVPQSRGHYGHAGGGGGSPRERGGVYGVPRLNLISDQLDNFSPTRLVNRQSPEFQQVAPYPGPGYGGQIYGSSSGGSVIRVQRESVGRAEGGGSTSSGSVQGRRKRSGLAQVERDWLRTFPQFLIVRWRRGQLPV